MRTITPTQLANILAAHKKWRETGGVEGSRADLTGADLTGADLTGADLTGADLTGADLTDADLADADLTDADLTGAILPDGRKWEDYQSDHLAGLCQTPEVRERALAAWGNHSWTDCPMHAAHGVTTATSKEMAAWVALYDAKLLKKPELPSAEVTP